MTKLYLLCGVHHRSIGSTSGTAIRSLPWRMGSLAVHEKSTALTAGQNMNQSLLSKSVTQKHLKAQTGHELSRGLEQTSFADAVCALW